ncbi:MAG: serine/threonine-protein phosphatase [Chloroflexota bacterium]|nr:serine/threonine-protein phosphatase [Chloroflexota bacterium]
MAFAIELGIAKTNKYASRESGDTAELVERPGGGFSVVMADGQGSGRAAKSLSLMVTSKAVALLKEGVRDGAVARGVHDFLFAFRHGQVSATLDILSVDLRSETIVITRNAVTPMLVGHADALTMVPGGSGPIGLYHLTRPSVTQVSLAVGLSVILTTDGIPGAGRRAGLGEFDLTAFAGTMPVGEMPAAEIADRTLKAAIARDQRRPADDMTVVALTLRQHGEPILIRRLDARIPLP